MNEFIVAPDRKLTPQQTVMGVLGISLEQFINEIRENRDGRYDCLYKKQSEAAAGAVAESR